MVAQENVLFSKSIYENIAYGMGNRGLPEATVEMVKAALDAANATEFVTPLLLSSRTCSLLC